MQLKKTPCSIKDLEVVRCYVSMYPAGHFRRRQEFTGLRANYLGKPSMSGTEKGGTESVHGCPTLVMDGLPGPSQRG